jgi:hypothetical protein
MTAEHRASMNLTRERRLPPMLTWLANAAIRRPCRVALAALAFVSGV